VGTATAAQEPVAKGDTALVVEEVGEVLRRELDGVPVILCGSLAAGDADEHSDVDLLVGVSLRSARHVLRKLPSVATELEARTGRPVSLNPLPLYRLRRPGRTIFVWKVNRDGRPIVAPPGFSLPPPGRANLTAAAVTSYALSALLRLIAHLRVEELRTEALDPRVAREVRRALLHAVQLRLLHRGRYAARFPDSLRLLSGAEATLFAHLSETADAPSTWFRVRELLIEEVEPEEERVFTTLARNLQYVALRRLRGGGWRPRALVATPSVAWRVGRATALLAAAVKPGGSVDPIRVAEASATLHPLRHRAAHGAWAALRDLVTEEWPHARPLLGV
jgi:predicted nucleotidyltransferase